MPTELDLRMNATIAALTGEGGRLALGQVERFGRSLPVARCPAISPTSATSMPTPPFWCRAASD
jgi:long-chain acyl-CoA synthetase